MRELSAKLTEGEIQQANEPHSTFSYYKEIEKRNFYDEYKKRCFVLGKKISFEKSGKTHFAYANDIDENFNLCVLEDDGTKSKLYSGEISIKC